VIDSWHSYPSIYHLGHKAVSTLLDGPVLVQEKVDGSQFSFARDADGALLVRSKGATMHPDAPEGMFVRGVDTAKRLLPDLHEGWTYRGEYLAKPKHNVLAYDRVPEGHVILFDINDGHEGYLSPEVVRDEAARLGIEAVWTLQTTDSLSLEEIREHLSTVSVLGGQKIEGVVIKPAAYDVFGQDKKVLMGKFVSEAFKEIHASEWKKENPGPRDILQTLGQSYRTPARWHKALQHLIEAGSIEGSPRDIGLLIREVPDDVLKECEAEIREALFAWAWPHVRRSITAGLPEWYKGELLRHQFDSEQPS
jgi:hypothetical protein